MDKLFRAILLTLPIPLKGTVARTYRRELAKLEAQGRAKRGREDWELTVIGAAYVDRAVPGAHPSSAPPPPLRPSHESGLFPSVRVPEPPPRPRAEPSGTLMVKVPQTYLSALDARAKEHARNRSEEVRFILADVLTAPPSSRTG